MPLISEPIEADHHLEAFGCGRPTLDSWLKEHALGAQARRVARTFVWHRGDRVVLAYHTLTAHVLVKDELPRALGHGSPRRIPAALLARLALDQALQHQGLGGVLLADALDRLLDATATVAARFVVVDALDEAAATFYEGHGFKRVPGTPRLVQKLSDVAAALRPGA